MKSVVRSFLVLLSIFMVVVAAGSEKGGVLRDRLYVYPKTLNYYLRSEVTANDVFEYTGARLLFRSGYTNELLPYLAKKWDMSKDRRTITFYLNESAQWPNGEPIVAEDVHFTFDLLMNKCVMCASFSAELSLIELVKVINPMTIQFVLKKASYDALSIIGNKTILPKKVYDTGDFEKDFNKIAPGGGPYILDDRRTKQGQQIVFVRREKFWADEYPHIKELYNFQRIELKEVRDEVTTYELFKRRELDSFLYYGETENYLADRGQPPFTDPRFALAEGDYPLSHWRAIGFNLRSGLTAELKFRQAINHLINRELMVDKILLGGVKITTGPLKAGSSESAKIPAVKFDPHAATKLLQEIGFKQTDDSGTLFREVTSDGKKVKERAELELILYLDHDRKWATVLQEDAKKVGVKIAVRLMDPPALHLLIDEFKFTMFNMTWRWGRPNNYSALRGHFHSSLAKTKGSNNYTGYADAETDQLFDQLEVEFDLAKRDELFHKIEQRLAAQVPYAFLWSRHKTIIGYWKDLIDTTENVTLPYSSATTHWRNRKK